MASTSIPRPALHFSHPGRLGRPRPRGFWWPDPSEAVCTPNLDRLAALGMNGLYHSYLQGVAMPSEIAHFLMFGYELEDFPGRGDLERWEKISPYPLSYWPCWVALLRPGTPAAPDPGGGRPQVDAKTCLSLQQDIKKYSTAGVEVEFVPTKGIQGLVIVRGEVSPGTLPIPIPFKKADP